MGNNTQQIEVTEGTPSPERLGSVIEIRNYEDLKALAAQRCVDLHNSMTFRDAAMRSREIFRVWSIGEAIGLVCLPNTKGEARDARQGENQ